MKKPLIFILSNIFCMTVMAQLPDSEIVKMDTVMINDICVDHICLGDSIKKLEKYFGIPDTVTYKPAGEWEFSEPSHKDYWYGNTIFYEIPYIGITDSLLYGFRIDLLNTSVFIKGFKMIIGKTTIDDIKNSFPISLVNMKNGIHDKYIHIYITFPPHLKSFAEASIYKITLMFTDNVLKQVETSFYLN